MCTLTIMQMNHSEAESIGRFHLHPIIPLSTKWLKNNDITHFLIFACVFVKFQATSSQSRANARDSGLVFSRWRMRACLSWGKDWTISGDVSSMSLQKVKQRHCMDRA